MGKAGKEKKVNEKTQENEKNLFLKRGEEDIWTRSKCNHDAGFNTNTNKKGKY